jgi:hypothetical protein
MTSRRAVLAVAILSALGIAFAVVVIRSQPEPYETRLDAYACTADPHRINVFTGYGPGDHVVGTDVREDRDKVTITIRAVDPQTGFQNLSLHPTTVPIPLKDPLGGRQVVDQNGRILRGQCP